MKETGGFRTEFLKAMADIQHTSVQSALRCTGKKTMEETCYDLSYDVIVRIMELIDGYYRPDMGRLDVVCEKNGERLNRTPQADLHDAVCDYLKCSDK